VPCQAAHDYASTESFATGRQTPPSPPYLAAAPPPAARSLHRSYVCAVTPRVFVRQALDRDWCDIIVLNVHAPIEDKIDDIKDRFYEEL
jgi:hypothetical protein